MSSCLLSVDGDGNRVYKNMEHHVLTSIEDMQRALEEHDYSLSGPATFTLLSVPTHCDHITATLIEKEHQRHNHTRGSLAYGCHIEASSHRPGPMTQDMHYPLPKG